MIRIGIILVVVGFVSALMLNLVLLINFLRRSRWKELAFGEILHIVHRDNVETIQKSSHRGRC